MVTHFGIGLPSIRTRRHPGDLRWPARKVVGVLALYVVLAWVLLSALVTALL